MRDDGPSSAFRFAAWFFVALLLLAAFFVMMPGIGIAAWCVAIFVAIEVWRKSWASQQYALLWMLTVSAERAMPLSPALEAFARERGGRFGRRARRLAELLEAGVPLPNALERVRGLLPSRALSMIRVGYEAGALAPALRQATVIYSLHEPIWMGLIGKIAYLLVVPTFGTGILVFIMLKIVPAYQKIFEDFHARLPPLTIALIGVSNFYAQYWYLFPLPLLGLLLLGYALMRYWGWTDWDLPGAARLVRQLDSAQVLDSLALVAGQQRPLGDGIAALALSYPKSDVRYRLRLTEADVRGGRDWCESLLDHGLIRSVDRAVLQAAQRVGNLSWALAELADSTRRRLVYRVQTIVQVAFPPLIILIGAMVMFVVVALFIPLIALIWNLSQL